MLCRRRRTKIPRLGPASSCEPRAHKAQMCTSMDARLSATTAVLFLGYCVAESEGGKPPSNSDKREVGMQATSANDNGLSRTLTCAPTLPFVV